MAKLDLKAQKRIKNEEYARKYQKEKEQKDPDQKKLGGQYGSWCRIKDHPSSCNCTYT
jgi:hypothetical protein